MSHTRRCLITLLVACLCRSAAAQVWVEDTFADFNDGTFDASGQNLYATAGGRVKTIHRFDLNADGFHDLVFNSSHDFVTAPPATLFAQPPGRAPGRAGELPVRGSRCAAVADLNKDGHQDIVICPNHNWATSRRFALIFWGGADGWVPQRMTNLITIDPRAVGVADLNGDTWPDIVVLNGTRWAPEDGPEKVLRIYWGSPQAYRQESFRDIVLGDATDLAVADLDGDGRRDLAILEYALDADGRRGDARLLLYWSDAGADEAPGEPQQVSLNTTSVAKLRVADVNGDDRADLVVTGGVREVIGRDPTTGAEKVQYAGLLLVPGRAERRWGEPQAISAPKASDVQLADVNGDGRADLIVAVSRAESDSVRVLPGLPDGRFDADAATTLPIARASAIGTADFDGDGHLDLAVGVDRGADTYQSASRIFYGHGDGRFSAAVDTVPTSSVSSLVIAPGHDGPGHRILFCNNMWGRINEDVPVFVYYGGPDGFSTDRLDKFRIRSGYCSNAADINDDGHVDLIIASIVHAVSGTHTEIGYNILWGDAEGLLDDRRTVVPEYAMTNGNVGDLDRDGYLDLTGSCNHKSDTGEPTRLVIWHGGPDGYTKQRRVVIPCEGVNGPNVIADFDRDDHLDVAVSCGSAHNITIFRGGDDGFDAGRRVTLPLVAADDMNTADLNGDGWLDLIVTSYFIPGTLNYDFGTYIFWGSPGGFSPTNAQRLRTSSGCGIGVADYDGDGHLDVHIPNYKWTEIRESIQSFLFWGSPTGYSDRNRTALLIDSGHATHSADFDGDGLIDLAISCHSRDGDHFVNSRVYYNDGRRFTSPRCQLLPTIGPHYMHRADVGHQYDRSYRQRYTSSVFTWDAARSTADVSSVADTPGGSRLAVEVRSAALPGDLADAAWQASSDGRFALRASDRCLQYRAAFISDNGDRYPVLDRVRVEVR